MGRCCTRCHPRLFLRSLFETKAVVDHRLRLCVHINRDNRGSPGGGLSRWSWAAEGWTKRAPPGRPGHPTCRGLEGVTRRIGTMKGWSVYRGGGERGLVQRPYMQMVRIYREQRAAYEYVKWEMKQNERKRGKERRRDVGGWSKIGCWVERKRKWTGQRVVSGAVSGEVWSEGWRRHERKSREAFNDRRSSIASRASWVRDLFSSVFSSFFFLVRFSFADFCRYVFEGESNAGIEICRDVSRIMKRMNIFFYCFDMM